MSVRLTIAIPTYNRAELLKHALDSACAQTSREIEILVSDNASTDQTQQLLSQYSDPRLRIIRRETTLPRAEHGAFLFRHVQTELVLALSDDDYIEPQFSEEVLRLFAEHPEISFVYTGCMEHYDDVAMPALTGPRIEESLEFFAAHYAGQRQISWCACVLRVKDILECGPQPPDRIIGDMFFWTRIGFKGPVGCVKKPLSHYSVLRPVGDNESRVIAIMQWGNEVRLLAREVMERIHQKTENSSFLNSIQKHMEHYITRSIANQFIWNRISGTSRSTCLGALAGCLRFKGWTIGSISRVAAALILPRAVLRRLVVEAARKTAYHRAAQNP